MQSIFLYDTTLRDGTQGESISFTAEDKVKIAHKLDEMGIHYIEGGWPGSNPRDLRFFDMIQRETFQNAKIAAFGATRKPGIAPEDDNNLEKLILTQTPVVTIFGKTWELHVEKIMEISLAENLAMIGETVDFLKSHNREVIYDAEHFFDGYKANKAYALETLATALKNGADFLVLCDTNGGTLHFEVENIIKQVKEELTQKNGFGFKPAEIKIGIHTHNDCGLAVANTISAVKVGAIMVHGTVNGYGERCGNADLTSVIPILKNKMDLECISWEKLSKLKTLSRFISETANMIPVRSRPFVGKSAFAHKGGIHVNAIMKTPMAYEHIDPKIVGNKRRVLVSDLAGKSNVEYKANELNIELGANGYDSRKIVSEIKKLEEKGYQFDTADGSLKILIEKFTSQFKPAFILESFRISIEKDMDGPCFAHAIIKILVDGRHEMTAAEGNGPVSALDNALRKALGKFFPDLETMHLVDFKVRVIDGREGTAARVRVLIDSRDKNRVWTTIGVSEDIIEASWQALTDSFQYKLALPQIKK